MRNLVGQEWFDIPYSLFDIQKVKNVSHSTNATQDNGLDLSIIDIDFIVSRKGAKIAEVFFRCVVAPSREKKFSEQLLHHC